MLPVNKIYITTLLRKILILYYLFKQLYGRGEPYQYSIAVVRKGGLPNVQPGYGLSALRGAKACFPGVGALAGWVMPIHVVSNI